MKKLIILVMLLSLAAGCSKSNTSGYEEDYYKVVHDINKVYDEFAEKSSAMFKDIHKKVSDNVSVNIEKTLKDLDNEKQKALEKLEKYAKELKTDMGKELCSIKSKTVEVITESSQKALKEYKEKEQSLDNLKNSIEDNIKKYSNKIKELQDKEIDLYNKFEKKLG